MGHVDPELLLSLGDLWGPVGALLLLGALPIVLLIALKPRLLWPLLIVAALIGIGPRIKGYLQSFTDFRVLEPQTNGVLASP